MQLEPVAPGEPWRQDQPPVLFCKMIAHRSLRASGTSLAPSTMLGALRVLLVALRTPRKVTLLILSRRDACPQLLRLPRQPHTSLPDTLAVVIMIKQAFFPKGVETPFAYGALWESVLFPLLAQIRTLQTGQ